MELISTSELTPDNVPSPDDPKACSGFALTFPGYTYAGGFTELVELVEKFPCKEEGVWDLDKISVDDLRAAFFWEQRSTRGHNAGEPDEAERWELFERTAVVFVQILRHKLFGEPAPE